MVMVYNTADPPEEWRAGSDIQIHSGFGKGYINV